MANKNYTESEIIFQSQPSRIKNFDETGKKYARWRVLGYAGKGKWWCKCDCAVIRPVPGSRLRNAESQSCGCLRLDTRIAWTTHGRSSTSEYHSYCAAKARCNNPNNPNYSAYGGNGIKFLFDSFEEFYNILGDKPGLTYTLDRINPKGHYEPNNVRWVTPREQNNNKTNNKIIKIGQKQMTIPQWARRVERKQRTIYTRIYSGWCNRCAVYNDIGVTCPHKK